MPEKDFIDLYESAKKSFDDNVAKDKRLSRAKAVRDALDSAFTSRLSYNGVNSRARTLWKKRRLQESDIWHITRARNDKYRAAGGAAITTGSTLVTYCRDSNAGYGVYYAVLLGIPGKTDAEIIYIGSADGTFGSRQLMPDKYRIYSSRVPYGKGHIIETRCLLDSVASYEMSQLENWVTRCWSLLVKRLPALHEVKKNSGKKIPLEDLRRLDLDTLRKALFHLRDVGKAHEVKLWNNSGRGTLDLDQRIKTLIDNLGLMQDAVTKGEALPLVSGSTGLPVVLKEGTGFKMSFCGTPFAQWMTNATFTRKTLATTAAGQGLLSLK